MHESKNGILAFLSKISALYVAVEVGIKIVGSAVVLTAMILKGLAEKIPFAYLIPLSLVSVYALLKLIETIEKLFTAPRSVRRLWWLWGTKWELFCRGQLLDPEWRLNEGQMPAICPVDASVVGQATASKINSARRHDYALDYYIIPPIANQGVVEFKGQFDTSSHPYVRILIYTKDGKQIDQAWFNVALGKRGPEKRYRHEWKIYTEQQNLGDGWSILRININEAFIASFATEGFVFHAISGFRLRGSMTLASIVVKK